MLAASLSKELKVTFASPLAMSRATPVARVIQGENGAEGGAPADRVASRGHRRLVR